MTPQEIMQIVITVVTSVLASSGLWSYVQKKTVNKDARSKLLLGLAHDRILYLGSAYIERGYITKDEYENLHDYLYLPYAEMGGNGTAKKVMQAVDRLELKNITGGIENETK